MSTTSSASATTAASNSVTVFADGKSDVKVTITEENGKLRFTVDVIDDPTVQKLSPLQSMLFSIKGLSRNGTSTLKVDGVRDWEIVGDIAGDGRNNDNVEGGGNDATYDVFLKFDPYVTSTQTFFLYDSASSEPLSLNLVGGQNFGFRLDSPTDKIYATASAAPNNPPVAANDVLQTSEDTPLTVDVKALLANDTDRDGNSLSVSGVSQGMNGNVVLANGKVTYTPNANFNGTDTFTYTVSDGQGGQSTATVTVKIAPVNDAPVAVPLTLPAGQQGQTVTITAADLLKGASDVDGDRLTISSLALSSSGGTLVDNHNGTWTYTPDAQHSGPVSFSYKVSDGLVEASSTASLVLAPVTSQPAPVGPTPAGAYDDLIEAGDGDDIIHGGRGNDEMQGEGGNDTIIGGTDDGKLVWAEDGTLTSVTIGDNLYDNDGNDTYFYAKGDGVDLIWDFRPDADTVVLGYRYDEIIGATYVTGVTNRIGTPSHDKIALILGNGDAIVINDFGGLRDSDREAFVFADGTKLSMKKLLALVEEKHVATDLPTAWSSAPGISRATSVRANNSLDLYGSNDGETLIGRGGDDRLYGNEGFNQLNGNDGRDELYGGNVSDVLVGGSGDDFGYGNGGDDTIVGGTGSDKLYGGGGRDIIYGDTDVYIDTNVLGDGSDFSIQGFYFKFGLDLETKYRDLFQSAEPVNGVGVTASEPVITVGKNWWGGFEVTLTVKADASVANWSLFLNSAYEITSIWGAELTKVQDGSSSDVYELKNAPWNGSLAKGQTTTIGFTVRTPFNLVVDRQDLLLAGLKIGNSPSVDPVVDGAVSVIAQMLSTNKEVTAAESYKLSSANQKAVAISGNKAIDIVGNKLANVIIGNDGANEISGGAGKDTLTGKGGKDTFVFDTKAAKSNVDKVTDFNVKDDMIHLDNAVFKKLGKAGKLNKDFFTVGSEAKDKNDYIVYDKAKGVLYYDADGSGAGKAVEIATLSKKLAMTNKDLLVI